MKNICLIPARGGSKRIPRKNIKIFFGKPLIAWSIEVAKQSSIFDEVFVSTDDIEIANIARSYGAVVPFLRPKNLSDDYAIDKEVIEHFISWMSDNKMNPDVKFNSFYPTFVFNINACNSLPIFPLRDS